MEQFITNNWVFLTSAGIIGFFLRQQIITLKEVRDAVERVNATTTKLEINELKNSEMCVLRHQSIAHNDKEFKQRLTDIEKRVNELEKSE